MRTQSLAVAFLLALSVVICRHVELKCSTKRLIIDHHNDLRTRFLKGKVYKQPRAASMVKMLWDAELESKAKDFLSKEKSAWGMQNPDVTTSSGRFTTRDNYYSYNTDTTDFNDDVEAIEKAMKRWWDQRGRYTHEPYLGVHQYERKSYFVWVQKWSLDWQYKWKPKWQREERYYYVAHHIGRYTQMIWSYSYCIGCAVWAREYHNGGPHFNISYDRVYVTCTYGPAGNVRHELPYRKGSKEGIMVCVSPDCSRPYGEDC